MNKRLALHLTTYCYNVEPDYIFRTVPSHLTGLAATQYDQYQDTVIARIGECDGNLPRYSRQLRGLPTKYGGSGIHTHQSRREAADLISRTRTLGYMEQYWPDLLEVTMSEEVWKRVHIGNSDGITDAENLTELEAHHLEFGGTAKPVEEVAKRLNEIVDEGYTGR